MTQIPTIKPSLADKVALITGASRGIGAAIARGLAERNCNLILTARNEAKLKKLSHELEQKDKQVLCRACDVGDPKSVADLFQFVRTKTNHLDILINNAGIAHENLTVAKLPFQTWKDVFDTNLHGMFLITQGALPLMKRGSSIVNNLSIAANRVFAGSSAYNASKHAALGLTNTLREELRSQGIRVIGLLPGATDTEIWRTLWPDAPREKMMAPDTVAQAVVHAILLHENATVENLEILPSAGTL